MSTHSLTARAPADRAPGDRGPRGRVAAVLVVAAVAALALIRLRGHGSGGGGGGGGGGGAWQFQYSYDSPGWSTLGFLLAAAALASAGTVLWVARERRLVALASVLAIAGAGLVGWTIATPNDIRISPASYRSIPVGMTETALTSRLGAPFSTDASATSPRAHATIGCLMYQVVSMAAPRPQVVSAPVAAVNGRPPDAGVGATAYLFCFDRGRLRLKSAL